MSYYVKYSPSEDERYLPEAWKKEEYFTISLARDNLPPCTWKGEGGEINISEADELEQVIKEWYAEHGGEMTDFDRVFLENMRKAEAESRVAIDTKAIDKAYSVNLVKQEIADAELREHWTRVDASVGRWAPLGDGDGKYVWVNYKEGEGGKGVVPVKKPTVKKAPAKKKPEAPVPTVPLPITRVEVTLGGQDIVIELTSASDIPAILEGLKEQYGFSEKMKKKLDALLTQNKPT